MSLLWITSIRRTSAWEQDHAESSETHPDTMPVEDAGFAGFVSGGGLDDPGDKPHHYNDDLMDHLLAHSGGSLREMSQVGKVSIKDRPVYATQSHVTVPGVMKYLKDESHPDRENMPRFVRHRGNLYVDDGHHRVGAALLRGDDSVHGYYYNADKHGFPEPSGRDW